MSEVAMNGGVADVPSPRPHLDGRPHTGRTIAFLVVLLAGLGYAAFNIFRDMSNAGEHGLAIGAFVLLGIALLIALGFEFVNGFSLLAAVADLHSAALHLHQRDVRPARRASPSAR